MTDLRFKIPYSVRIADINYGGHVYNAAVKAATRIILRRKKKRNWV